MVSHHIGYSSGRLRCHGWVESVPTLPPLHSGTAAQSSQPTGRPFDHAGQPTATAQVTTTGYGPPAWTPPALHHCSAVVEAVRRLCVRCVHRHLSLTVAVTRRCSAMTRIASLSVPPILVLCLLGLTSAASAPAAPPPYVTTVHVISSNHLDVGFNTVPPLTPTGTYL